MWAVVCEDLPDVERRVTLAADLSDVDGLPAPAVHYRLDDNTRRMLAWHTERTSESLEAAGANSVESFPALRNGYSLQFYVKAYRQGDPVLGGIAGTRLVQVPLSR